MINATEYLCSQRYLEALLHFEPVLFAEVRFWYQLINCSCILFNMNAVQRSVQRAQRVQPRNVVCQVGACCKVLHTLVACYQRYLVAVLHCEPVLFAEVRFWYHSLD
jgi:hypothetical protein